MTKRKQLYFHKTTGDIVSASKSTAKKLSADYEPIQFVKNQEGVPVMRFRFNGATVDVSENIEKGADQDGNGDSE